MIRKQVKKAFLIGAAILLFIALGGADSIQAAPPRDVHGFPVIPAISGGTLARARSIYAKGQRTGNRKNVFSKVGDSITSWNYFLVPIGAGGLRLGGYTSLQTVVNHFSAPARAGNSFVTPSFAAAGAWTSFDLLNPNNTPKGPCNAGETPVACELRLNKPAVALIMIGTNDLPHGDVNAFRGNLDRIVSIVEQNNVIPVVSTIPLRRDNPAFLGRVGAFNDAIIAVAQAHAAPLWNYYVAMENLPENGLSSDGIHPGLPYDNNTGIFDADHLRAGFNMRNLTALQVLDRLLPVLR